MLFHLHILQNFSQKKGVFLKTSSNRNYFLIIICIIQIIIIGLKNGTNLAKILVVLGLSFDIKGKGSAM